MNFKLTSVVIALSMLAGQAAAQGCFLGRGTACNPGITQPPLCCEAGLRCIFNPALAGGVRVLRPQAHRPPDI